MKRKMRPFEKGIHEGAQFFLSGLKLPWIIVADPPLMLVCDWRAGVPCSSILYRCKRKIHKAPSRPWLSGDHKTGLLSSSSSFFHDPPGDNQFSGGADPHMQGAQGRGALVFRIERSQHLPHLFKLFWGVGSTTLLAIERTANCRLELGEHEKVRYAHLSSTKNTFVSSTRSRQRSHQGLLTWIPYQVPSIHWLVDGSLSIALRIWLFLGQALKGVSQLVMDARKKSGCRSFFSSAKFNIMRIACRPQVFLC